MRDRKLSRWTSRLGALTVVAVGLVIASPAGQILAASQTPYGVDLLRNPGAEVGTGTAGYTVVPIPGWTTGDGNFTVVRYGAPGFPPRSEAQRIHGGHKFFSCGENTDTGVIFQTIKLVGRKADIDAGKVRISIHARIATYGTQADEGWVEAYLLDSLAIGSVPAVGRDISTSRATATNGTFVARKVNAPVPKHTRFVEVMLYGVRAEGTYCDVYFDNIDVRIQHT